MKTIRILLLFPLLIFVTFTRQKKKISEFGQFKQKYIRLSWERELWAECQKGTLWHPIRAYMIFRGQILFESQGVFNAVEKKHGREISFGLCQNGFLTCKHYRQVKGIRHPKGFKKLKQWAFKHSVEIFMWKNRIFFKKYGDFKLLITMHNFGETGYFRTFKKKYPHKKYWISVDMTRKYIPKKYKELL